MHLRMSLEIKPQSKLNHAWVVDRFIYNTERRRTVDILHKNSVADQPELSMIEKVEEFSPELNCVSLADAKILEGRKICIHESGTGKWRTRNVAKFPYWRWHESTRIEPILVVVQPSVQETPAIMITCCP